eukprot:g1708.t1
MRSLDILRKKIDAGEIDSVEEETTSAGTKPLTPASSARKSADAAFKSLYPGAGPRTNSPLAMKKPITAKGRGSRSSILNEDTKANDKCASTPPLRNLISMQKSFLKTSEEEHPRCNMCILYRLPASSIYCEIDECSSCGGKLKDMNAMHKEHEALLHPDILSKLSPRTEIRKKLKSQEEKKPTVLKKSTAAFSGMSPSEISFSSPLSTNDSRPTTSASTSSFPDKSDEKTKNTELQSSPSTRQSTLSFKLPPLKVTDGDSRSALYEADSPQSIARGTDKYKEMESLAQEVFSKNATEGIAIMVRNSLIDASPEGVAQWLFEMGDALDSRKKGDYLGSDKDFNVAVMESFVQQLQLEHLNFDAAIRAFLCTFSLPGEAQKIERLLDAFAKRYCSTNPGVLKDVDTASALAFGIIMLNTDLHNENAQETLRPPMDEETWINLVNETTKNSISQGELSTLYNSVKQEAILLPTELRKKNAREPTSTISSFMKGLFT